MSRRQQSLLTYLDQHPPDLDRRSYLKVPPPPMSKIIDDKGEGTQAWLKKISGDAGDQKDEGLTISSSVGMGQSLVAPLLWVPGVLRSQGAWTTAMKETLHGPVLAVQPGVNLANSELMHNIAPRVSLEEEILHKDQLIQELERSLNKQKIVADKLIHKSEKHAKLASKLMDKARNDERKANEEARGRSVALLQGSLQQLREDLRTTRKAAASRVRRAYAQDNFLSQYAKALTTVRQQAAAIADVEHAGLRNRVSALTRQLKRDAIYKAALKQRTEIAEQAADKRWSEAESKIPHLEECIHDAKTRFSRDKLLSLERDHRHQRELERLKTLLHREQEARAQAESLSMSLQKKLGMT